MTSKTIIAGILILGAAMTLMTIPPLSAEPTNILVNGSFEEPSADCTGTNVGLPFGSTTITGWAVSGLGIDWICTLWDATDGTNSIDLNRGQAGAIYQTVPLEVGADYDVSFDMAGNYTCGDNIKEMNVFANSELKQFSFDTTGKSATNMGYVTETFSFTAAVPSTQIIFASSTAGACGAVIDNVSIIKNVSDEQPEKVDVCHKGKKTINISVNAVPAHLAHGDTLGSCQ